MVTKRTLGVVENCERNRNSGLLYARPLPCPLTADESQARLYRNRCETVLISAELIGVVRPGEEPECRH